MSLGLGLSACLNCVLQYKVPIVIVSSGCSIFCNCSANVELMKDKEEEKRAADGGWWVDETVLRWLGSASYLPPLPSPEGHACRTTTSKLDI